MRVVTVVGARPQFVKAAPVSRALRTAGLEERLVHTGQHYDDGLSGVFFRELDLAPPAHHLGVGSGSHGVQTGAMLVALERVLEAEAPDLVLVYGDTNSTLAGALAAAKQGRRVAHVEAGLRSFNRSMPEEINRVITDRLSSWLLCPSRQAMENLEREGMAAGARLVGDVMADALAEAAPRARRDSRVLDRLGLREGGYLLATVHRAGTADDPARLSALLRAFGALDEPVVFPVHPRTAAALDRAGLAAPSNVRRTGPVGYLDALRLQAGARLVLTDSGGMQKEAYWLGVPCLTLREETEWVETVQAGWNRLVGTDPSAIAEAVRTFRPPAERPELYGDGRAAGRCAAALLERVPA